MNHNPVMRTPAVDPTPFSSLTPVRILDCLDAIGLHADGRLQALNSYENRVWLAGVDERDWVVLKFYRAARWSDEQILEEHQFTLELAADEVPVVAPLSFDGETLLHVDELRFAIYPRQGGRAPELDRPEVLGWMGRLMARIHQVGGRQRFEERERLDPATLGHASRDWLLTHEAIPSHLVEPWAAAADAALAAVDAAWASVGPVRTIRLHGDCHMGNVLWTPVDEQKRTGGPHFVDFDDARSGPAVQDLWMLLGGTDDEMQAQLDTVLAGYCSLRDFDTAELGLIEPLRTLRLIHHSAWIARRWRDPAFPAAFPWFAQPRYWEERIVELREQVEQIDRSALVGRHW